MDVRSFGYLVLLSIFAAGCAKSGSKTEEITTSFETVKCQSAEAIPTEFIVQWEDGTFSVEKSESPEKFKQEFVLPRENDIKLVQINQKVRQLGRISQQNIFIEQSNQYGLEQIEADAVWSQGFRGQNIIVGVVDSRVDVNHRQLRDQIAINTRDIPNNGIDDDGNGVVDDTYGAQFFSSAVAGSQLNDHGTHVAGIIAADPNSGSISGTAPESKIVPSAFLDSSGAGTLGDAILAMQYAASRGARVINASWGGNGCADTLAGALSQLSRQGILMVVAAGNSGLDVDVYDFFPASFDLSNQITVAASDSINLMPAWSNNGYKKVHLTAPGVNIFSTGKNNSYLSMDGTSMAAPFVAGAAASLWSARPQASAGQIKQALLSGVDVISGRNSKTLTRGRLNLRKSLDELRRIAP